MTDRRQISSSLSAKMVDYLRSRGHAQADIARMLGVSEAFVSLVKSKERSLTIDHFERLSEALSVPLGALLLAITEQSGNSGNAKKLYELSARVVEQADSARAAILRGAS